MPDAKPTYVLVHGGWCGAWAWDELAPHLDGTVVAVDLPSAGPDAAALGDLQGDVDVVREAVEAADGPVVLCGHSSGGMPITELGDHPGVSHSVYLTAFFPPAGATMISMLGGGLPDWITDRGDGGLEVTKDPVRAREVMCADLDEATSAEVCGKLELQSLAFFQQASTGPTHTHPTTYVICEEDGAIPPPAQEGMAQQADHVVRLRSAHFPQHSVPEQVAEVLNDVARQVA